MAPLCPQAKSIAKREVAEATEETKVVEEASRKVSSTSLPLGPFVRCTAPDQLDAWTGGESRCVV